MLNAVLDAGINFIDTSPDYGVSEERIGRFLAGRRAEFILATKCGCVPRQHDDHLEIDHVWKREVIQQNVETSLTRLRTATIDLLQRIGERGFERIETCAQRGLFGPFAIIPRPTL